MTQTVQVSNSILDFMCSLTSTALRCPWHEVAAASSTLLRGVLKDLELKVCDCFAVTSLSSRPDQKMICLQRTGLRSALFAHQAG